jgi:transposase
MYILLTRVENAFRNMKNPLTERPIYPQREHRVETHSFLCVLAYHLLVAIEKTLLDRGVHTSWASVREVLSTHQVCTIVLPTDEERVLRIRKGSTPEPEHTELYELLGIPKEIIRPTRTSEPQSRAEM